MASNKPSKIKLTPRPIYKPESNSKMVSTLRLNHVLKTHRKLKRVSRVAITRGFAMSQIVQQTLGANPEYYRNYRRIGPHMSLHTTDRP